MKFPTRKSAVPLLAILLALAFPAFAAPAPAEGVWRGEFNVNGEPLPFNFELRDLGGGKPVLTLINGTRRDHFALEQRGDGSLRAVMNTYDAALEARVVEDSGGRRLEGHYRDLVPRRNGANDLGML
ncbi:hypothetical protein [Luteimonas marina]|uniref:hypothetical protein n=1 Tax=Luteimonas marina TaxID=488485 RepID=UPI001EE328B4|nr:hypothetical protein [Luteimonas marina]